MSARIIDINAKLERDIAIGKAADRRARLTDAATHLRHAIRLVDESLEATTSTTELATLLVQAADKLADIMGER